MKKEKGKGRERKRKKKSCVNEVRCCSDSMALPSSPDCRASCQIMKRNRHVLRVHSRTQSIYRKPRASRAPNPMEMPHSQLPTPGPHGMTQNPPPPASCWWLYAPPPKSAQFPYAQIEVPCGLATFKVSGIRFPLEEVTTENEVVESDEVSPQPPFLQAEQPQLPQPLPISLVLQTLPQLRCPSLDTLQPLNVSLVVRGPTLNTAFEVRPHQCRAQGHSHCPAPAGHTIADTSQDAIGFLGHLGTLPAHVQAAVDQHPQVLFFWTAFQLLFPKPVVLHGVAVAQVQDPALSLVEPHTIGPSPWIQPVQVPLQSLPTLQQINTPTQLGVICKLTEGALDPLVQIIDKDIKQEWPQHRALGNTACDRPPTGFNSKGVIPQL
ncbi:hypothetical protein QYF61_010575 [Mycteria americana]|uniref:Uncharacterized protein n=1 Tax=Mycteria americana TaxID=33587 RepID=A0AAN7NJQ8_MYCAM|nr:hypothetical protein QYF61_010575 [Mycteria americana]